MLPEGIPTVTVTGRYLTPDGRPLSGAVVWRAPLLTFADHDVILGGPVTAQLDSTGAFTVTLPATDADGMIPTGWAYAVAEQIAGVATNRTYAILLPAENPRVDIADLAPTDPSTPTYVAVRGDSAYEVAVEAGFEGTVEQWLASLVGPRGATGDRGQTGAPGLDAYEVAVADGYSGTRAQWLTSLVGPRGERGEQGEQGVAGAPGVVQSVNGISEADVVLDAADVGAVPITAPGAPGGVAQLDDGGKVRAEQLPTGNGGAVTSVNGQTGDVVLNAAAVGAATADHTHTAAQVGALAASARAVAGGVASLDAAARLPAAQLPATAPRNVWTPGALGFAAWSVDPAHVANPTGGPKAAVLQRLYLSGINITETTPVNAVVIFARGWAGSGTVPAARFYAGIYNEAGNRVATSGLVSNLPAAGQLTGTAPGAKNNHTGAVPVPLTATANLSPGRYWAAFLMTAGSATDFYYMHTQNEAPSAPANFFLGTTFQRAWCLASQTSLPTTINQAAGEVGLDPAIMALAMV
ncbi:hypothetical protein [Streptomyces sp. KR2]|uniref:hypothetical protein n=1 Tax=Streptomyces sp. KR2 TaxID=1514824 RepID=UPI003F7E3B95